MKKRILSIILTLAMCLTMLPTAAVAADETQEVRYSTDGGATWTEACLMDVVNNTSSAQQVEIELLRSFTLVNDENWSEGYHVSNNNQAVTIDGKGHTITRGTGVLKMISVGDNSTVTLKNITIDGGAVWSSDDPATRTNSGIALTGNEYYAPLFDVYGGATLILDDGAVLQNSDLGGSICAAAVTVGAENGGNGGTLQMKPGSVIRNNQSDAGSAIYVNSSGTLQMTGGEIYGNYGITNGAIYISGGSATMTGGEIYDNVAGNNGGGVCIGSGTFTMSAGSIRDNSAAAGGGGVSAFGGGFVMTGGSVTGNSITGSMGGGVLVHNNGTLNMSGAPTVTGNTASGGVVNNVYLNGSKTVTLDSNLTGGSVGVTTSNDPTDDSVVSFAIDSADNNDIPSSAKYFSSDKGYKVGPHSSLNYILVLSMASDLADAMVSVADAGAHDGTEKKPAVTVILNGQTLAEGTDYTVSYENNINAGTSAKVTVTAVDGSGRTGSKETAFEIKKGAGEGTVTMADWTYGEQAKDPVPASATNGVGSVTYEYKLKDADDSTYTGTIPSDVGTYTVRATFAATSNYKEVTAICDFTIRSAPQDAPAAPELDSKSTDSVTLKEIVPNANGAAAEYSSNGGTTWQDSPVFTGLSAGTTYSFAARYTAIDNYEASPASEGTEITTDDAPYVPPYTPPSTLPYVPPYTPPTSDDDDDDDTPSTPPAQNVTVPISGEENTINVGASVSGDKAVIDEVDLSHLDTVIGDHVDVGIVTIDFSVLDSSEPITTVEIPADVVKQIAEAVSDPNNNAESLEIILSDGTSIEFDAAALGEKAAQADGEDITISIESHEDVRLTNAQKKALGNRPAYDINVTSGGKHISDMGGKVTIHAPYELKPGEKAEGIVVYYVDENGSRERCETSYNPINKRVNWQTDHLSLYMIDYDENLIGNCKYDQTCPMYGYTDLDMTAWYHDGVHFCIENGLMTGSSETTFAPDMTTSRAMIVTILWRLEGEPVVNYAMDFDDVATDTWYTEAVRWAASEGIVSGYSDEAFGPNDEITREQLATILYRYEQSNGGGFKGLWMYRMDYADLADVSDWAYEAMCWMNMNGIVTGKPGKMLDPQGSATRAEVATMLYRYCEVMTGGNDN